jgi:hypothetical protein
VVVGVLLVLGLVGCGTPPETLRMDVEAYLERARAWSPVESHTMLTVERIFGTHFVDEPEVRRQIAESTPRVQKHLTSVRQYEPRTADVQAVHRAYLKAWDDLLQGYAAIEKGFDTGDYTHLAQGRRLLEAWQAAIVDTARQLRTLVDRTGASAAPSQPA